MSSEIVLVAFYFGTLVYSVILHEISHGFVALWLGDVTAKYQGRLTFNPISHIDPVGSILVPLLLIPTGFAFGYAKPVPYNPYNVRDQKWGPLMVALAGPATNFLLAFFAAFMTSILPITSDVKSNIRNDFYGVLSGERGEFFQHFEVLASTLSGSFPNIFFGLLLFIIFWNVVLGCFNLLPIPPLDGSKLIFAIFSVSEKNQYKIEKIGFFTLIFVAFLLPGLMSLFTRPVIEPTLRFFFNLTL